MATKRLGVWEKQSIISSLEVKLSSLRWAAEWPYDVDRNTVFDTIWFAVDPELKRLIQAVQNHPDGKDTIDYGWRVTAQCTFELNLYDVDFNHRFPQTRELTFDRYTCPAEVHDKIGQFCKDQWTLTEQAKDALQFLRIVVEHCNSAGQILRLVPWIPDYLGYDARDSLGDAERKSRIPAAIKEVIDTDVDAWHNRLESASNTMALAHMANENASGDRRKIEVKLRS